MFPMSSASSWRLLARHQQRCCPARVHLRALQTTTATRTRNFKEDVKERKHAARRYVVLENCNPRKDINNLLSKHRIDGSYLSSQLNVEVTDHWTWFFRRRNFLLLELANRNEVQRLQAQAGYQSHSFPVQTRMLRANIDLPETALVEREDVNDHRHQQMLTSELRLAFDCGEIRKQVPSKQFATYLEENNCLTELDLRLRYFLLTELEDQLCGGVFDGFQIYPFGSSLAGLGDGSSDLDLVMLHRSLRQQGPLTFAHPEVRSERDQTQLALSMLADAFKNFIPNFSSINRILRARVPIVKAGFELAPIDLDISIELSEEGAHHGFIMANYIAYAINADPMVRQLFAFLKLWARQHGKCCALFTFCFSLIFLPLTGLVRSIAGNWFSNFQIITLAMYFLQTKNILKPFETYQNSEKNVEAKSKLKFEQLIYDFFEFVVSFNFEKDGKTLVF